MVYEPYGKSTCRRISDGNETVASHFGNPYLFTGRELDAETGLYNYNHRYYSPTLQRFINTDPIGYLSGDVNLYRYVGNRPTSRVDPRGTISRGECLTLCYAGAAACMIAWGELALVLLPVPSPVSVVLPRVRRQHQVVREALR